MWKRFFRRCVRKADSLASPLILFSSHDCGNQRYLAIPWFDTNLTAHLPEKCGIPPMPMPSQECWFAAFSTDDANVNVVAPMPASKFGGALDTSVWLPNETVAAAWVQYMKDTAVTDTTPPPAPTNLQVTGDVLTWSADADHRVSSGFEAPA